MSDANQSTANRGRWFKFSLRTLLVLVTVAAVASWGYGVTWPWWQAYREQTLFEAAIQHLKLDDDKLTEGKHIPSKINDVMQSTGDANCTYIVGKYIRTNARCPSCRCCLYLPMRPNEPRRHKRHNVGMTLRKTCVVVDRHGVRTELHGHEASAVRE